MDGQIEKAKSIFLNALEIAAAEERRAYLEAQCGADLDLRREVEELLRHQEQVGVFLESHAPGIDSSQEPIREAAGTVIGPYKLLQEIGEGGMGVVFMAEQTRPVERKVALKVIKPGMDTRHVIARFEAERQALALMDHVNIARVLDAGATPESPLGRGGGGRPYFVMELVHGVPITQYCDDNRLTPRQRLELFVPVCHAIQHAHQKGIIHRDVKPSNILITLYDGKPVPKVIDFGVAKATEKRLTERTLFTQFGTMVGTFEYMSPEQAEMSGLGIDTRSDIYSLGVLLYELLTGSTPLSRHRLREAAYGEILRMIREEEPPRPSTRLSGSGEALASISAKRDTEPARLTKLVRGELDWIVMKTLEKDRNCRYETANGLAADVLRYLNDEPVEACPPSAGYRLRKFARRNKGPVLAASAIALSLLGGIIGTTCGLVRAEEARRQETLRADGERQAKQEAEARGAETQAVLEFVEKKILAAARPEGQEGGLGRDVTLRRAIEAALPFVEESFTHQPLIEARLRRTLGVSFTFLGEAGKAAEQFQTARTLYARHRGAEHRDTLETMGNLASIFAALGRYADALELREETLALQKARLGPRHPDTLWTMSSLALSYQSLGRFADALRLLEATLELTKLELGPDHADTLLCRTYLANTYASLARYTDALRLREETLALTKSKLGPDHWQTLAAMHDLANSYSESGRHAEALGLREATLALRKARLGADHPDTLASMNNLANSYAELGRHDDAVALHEETLALRKTKLGLDHPDTIRSMGSLAVSYFDLGRHEAALQLEEQTLALQKAKFGSDHPDTIAGMGNLAGTLTALGRHAEGLKLFEETLALQKAKLGPDHRQTLASLGNVAGIHDLLGRHAEALLLNDDAVKLLKAKLGPDHPDTLLSMTRLSRSYALLGRHAEAFQVREETLALRKAKLGPDHPDTLVSLRDLAESLAELDRGAEAVSIIDECLSRSGGKHVNPRLIPGVVDLRLRHFERTKDAAGCRATAEIWEKLARTDAASLYNAACMRAVTARVIGEDPRTPADGAARLAGEEADRAMAWLERAVAAGFKDASHAAKDKDLDPLRERADFRMLLTGLEAGEP